MVDFLLELRSEEIPARMQAKACADLAALFAREIAKAGIVAGAIETYATPRRLALIARGLPLTTEAASEEIKGPRASAPPQAIEGFLRKTGLTREALVERDGVFFAVIAQVGRATEAVLGEVIPSIVRGFPWPKAMRWGAASASTASLRWVRPLQGIVALLGDDVVPCEVDGIVAGAATLGHRFHHPGVITIGNADDYAAKLRACHVVLDPAERQAIIREGAAAAAAAAGLAVVPDEGLVAENAGLTEWPVPLLGRFDPAFLEVPREVIQLTMRTNQKYFACVDAEGRLAPAFVCTANIDAVDGGAGIVAGNSRVLAARLSDARFFWEQDLKGPLAEQAKKLSDIVFHEKLGTVADKAVRVAKLARWLVEEGIVRRTPSPLRGEGFDDAALADLAEQAALLCKADLVTGMVGEFPELQGVMGGYYAAAQGLDPQVADAIRDHYKPVGQGDEVPTAPVTVAVSLADKLDTLIAFFGVDEIPTGSRDPFALRRAAFGVLQLLSVGSLRVNLQAVYVFALQPFIHQFVYRHSLLKAEVDAGALSRAGIDPLQAFDAAYVARMLDDPVVISFVEQFASGSLRLLVFFAERLKVQQREAGVRHDLIDAVFALGEEADLVRLLARVKALQAFVATSEGRDLLAGYKRAANILKKEAPLPGKGGAGVGRARELALLAPTPSPFLPGREQDGEGAEDALVTALDVAEPAAREAVEREDFAAAMTALASLRAPIDAFFEQVTVNDPDPVVRERRLGLLARIRSAVHGVADFSKIEG